MNGSVAKIIASMVTYPYQVIKSRLQQRGANSSVTATAGAASHTIASGSTKEAVIASETTNSSSWRRASLSQASLSRQGHGQSQRHWAPIARILYGLQSQNHGKMVPKYAGTWDCAVKIWRCAMSSVKLIINVVSVFLI